MVVRGCRFGQSREGLDALRAFFGGGIYVWAPRGFQGYEVSRIGSGHLQSAEEAFDMLQSQGQIPQDLELSAEEKRLYLQNELGIRGAVPSEFFVMGEESYRAVRGSISRNRGLTDEVNEEHVNREGVDIPSQGELWGLSSPNILGRDPELDSLSLEEIERRARILHDSYQPSHAPMLIRLDRYEDSDGFVIPFQLKVFALDPRRPASFGARAAQEVHITAADLRAPLTLESFRPGS